MMDNKATKGLSLLELLLALAVIAIIALISIRYYVLARNASLITQTETHINAIVQASYQWVQSVNGNFCGLGQAGQSAQCTFNFSIHSLMAQSQKNPYGTNLLPEGYELNPFNPQELINIQPSAGDGNHVQISLNLPTKSCHSLMDKLSGKAYKNLMICKPKSDTELDEFSGTF